MTRQSIEVITFTVHRLHDDLSIVVINEATVDSMKGRVLSVPGPINDAGDHLHLTELKNLLGRNPRQKFRLRQRATTFVARDITATFDIMMAVMQKAQETADTQKVEVPALALAT